MGRLGKKLGITCLYTQGETYIWSLSNTTVGSITSGQGTNSATILWNNVQTLTTVDVVLTIQKCTLPPQIFTYQVTVRPLPIIAITGPDSVCSGAPITLTVVSTNGVPLPPNTIVTWNSGTGSVIGGLSNTFNFVNSTASNIGRNITAIINQPLGCAGSTNLTNFSLSIFPSPPATLSIASGGNTFCDESEIITVLTAATSTSGVTIEWYFNNNLILPVQNGTVFNATPALGFGVYKFKVTDTNGCFAFSNTVNIFRNCGNNGGCEFIPTPDVTNDSENNCGIINLIGSTSVTPLEENWQIIGPNINLTSYTGSQILATAGEYHLTYRAFYICTDGSGNVTSFSNYKKVTVPYIPNFHYTAECNGNNNFTVTLDDETNFYSQVTDEEINFYYRPFGTPVANNILISGNTLNGLAGGNYTFTVAVRGKLEGVWQPECTKEIQIFLATMPTMTLQITDPPLCHDTAVGFTVTNVQITDTFLWTFDEGTQSTLKSTKRVFTNPGTYLVSVLVTNRFGCSQLLETQVIIPEKCFAGNVVSIPSSPTVCAGEGITLTYTQDVSQPNTCPVDQYIWMNGTEPILPAVNESSIQVFTEGFYWVKLKSANLCEYNTPNRITPNFKPIPSLSLSAEATVCLGSSFLVKATSNASAISWSVNGVLQPQFNNVFTPVFTNLTMGTQIITATVTLEGCSNSASLTVEVQESPYDLIILEPEMQSCSPYTYKLTAYSSNPAAVYNWSDGQLGNPIFVTSGGPYRVTASIGNCSVSAQTDVPKDPEAYAWIFPQGCYSGCKEDIGTLIGPRAYLPYWGWIKDTQIDVDGVNSFPTPYTIQGTGEYAFTLNTADCAFTTEPMTYTELDCDKCLIEKVEKRALIRNEEKFCSFTVVIDITSSVALNAVLSATSNNLIITPSAFAISAGVASYTFTIVPLGNFAGGFVEFLIAGVDLHGNHCLYNFELFIPACVEDSTNEKNQPTNDTKEGHLSAKISFNPNPTNGNMFFVHENLALNTELFIYDLTGRLMNKYIITTINGEHTIDLQNYPSGIFIAVLKNNDNILFQYKIVKQ